MALNISAWSIRTPLPAIVFSIIVVALGAVSFNRLPITRLPNVDLPNVAITVVQGGAAPAELEAQVTKTIEDAVSSVEGVKHIQSSITDSVSVTSVIFNLEVNSDRALNDVKDAVSRVRSELPRGIEEPLVRRVDVTGLPIVTYAAISPGKTPEQLSWFVDDVVERTLQGVRGVGRVERIGGVEREILVSLNPDRLQALGLTAADVSRRLRSNTLDLAGGRAEIGGRDEAIRTVAGARTLEALQATIIALPTGGQVRLDDLGVVTDTIADPRTFARLDGEPVVAFGIVRSKGASDVTVAAAVAAKIDEIKAANPDVELKLIDSSVKHTVGNYDNAIHTLFEGAALAVIAVLIFLRDVRATVIAAITLPLSIFPAFWAMDALGFSLNLVSLLAITLSTGIIVDDAIVEIENIVRHIRMGKSAYQAAIEAADEIGLAVIAISLTIIAVFAPASFMGSVAGQFFKQFGITVSVQILFSLLAARLVTPMLAAYFMRSHAGHEERQGRVEEAYAAPLWVSGRPPLPTVLRAARRLALERDPAAARLPAQAEHRALGARDRAAVRLAAQGVRGEDRGNRQAAAHAPGGAERVRRRRAHSARFTRTAQGDADHQLPAESRPENHAGGPRAEHQPRPLERSRHPLLVPRRQRPARHLDRDHGQRQRDSRQRRRGNREPDAALDGGHQRGLHRGARSSRAAHHPAPGPRRAAQRVDRGALRRDPRGDDRGRGAEPGEVLRRRPGDPDPRPDRRQRARRSPGARASAGADLARRNGAAAGRRRHRAWARSDQHQSLRSATPGDRRGGRRGQRRARRGARRDRRPAGHEEPARRRQTQQVGRRRGHGRSVRRFFRSHAQRPDHGLCRAGAAVRQLPSADHHPVFLAAVDRRGA